jgi:hypothetical protein
MAGIKKSQSDRARALEDYDKVQTNAWRDVRQSWHIEALARPICGSMTDQVGCGRKLARPVGLTI